MGNDSRIFDRRQTGIAVALPVLAAIIVLQAIVGIAISTQYHGTLEKGHADVAAMRSDGLFRFLLGFHYWGSAMLIVLATAAILIGAWTGAFARAHRLSWWIAIGFLLCGLGLQFTGNLLPMDRHDVQTVVVESGIVARAPIVGASMRQAELNGDSFGQPTLSRWIFLHDWVLPAFGLLLVVATVLIVRQQRSFRPSWVGAAVIAISALAMLGTPTGVAATALDANRFDASPSWYSWPLHGSLSLFQSISPSLGWIGAFVVPGLVLTLFVGLPYLPSRSAPKIARIGILASVLYFGIATLGFGGRIAPIVGDQGPVETDPAIPPRSVAADPTLIAKGANLFNSVGCADCHGDYGLKGNVGPTLNAEAQKGHDASWLIAFISKPSTFKPGTTMPSFGSQLKPEEIKAIIAFLLRPDPTRAPITSSP